MTYDEIYEIAAMVCGILIALIALGVAVYIKAHDEDPTTALMAFTVSPVLGMFMPAALMMLIVGGLWWLWVLALKGLVSAGVYLWRRQKKPGH